MTVFLVTTLLKIAIVLGVILTMVAYTVMAERKVSAFIQDRIGPNRVGPFGLLQPLADGLKFLFKEDFTPGGVNKFYFTLAPALAMAPALITACVLPFGSVGDATVPLPWIGPVTIPQPGVIANLDIGVLFVFAFASLTVYGIVLAGWASNSKYPFFGGIRSSAQMISYEVALGLSVVPVFLVTGQLNLSKLVAWQAEHGWLLVPFMGQHPDWHLWFVWPFLLVSFLVFTVSSFAEANRAPFDLPESETELIGGYHTEYSSMRFALFFLGEYAAMIVASGVLVTLFAGGWALPLGWIPGLDRLAVTHWLVGEGNAPWWFLLVQAAVFLGKVAAFLFFFIWVRWTVPRFRYDQLMHLGWKVFLPLALANVMVMAVVVALIG